MIPSRYNTWSYQVRRFYLEKHMVIRTHWARGGNKYVTLYFFMSCWEKSASLFLIFLFLLLVCNSLGHVANRPDYHVNLILPYRFFDNLRPQSYLKASVFFLGEAYCLKRGPKTLASPKFIFLTKIASRMERVWIAQRSRNTTGCPRSSCLFQSS